MKKDKHKDIPWSPEFDLRPCPFCGSKAVFQTGRHYSDDHNTILFSIECKGCGVNLPHLGSITFKLWDSGSAEIIRDDRQKMVDQWNGKSVEE